MAFQKAKMLQEAERLTSQGKVTQSIKLYLEILDNDLSDLALLNTVGDLFIKERNVAEGLKQFHRLAEAYIREGFNVKAIAIYRKISKVDPNSVDTLLKLAELYQLQGLSREARENYLQATEFLKKRNQGDRALEVFRKLALLDPDNINLRNRLAAEYEQLGKSEDAAETYRESAEILLRRDDQATAETALKKAAELDPKNSKIQMLQAQMAVRRQEPEEVERIISSSAKLQSDPAGKRLLLDSYLGVRKLDKAEKLVVEVFRANPADFAPVSSVSALLVENGDIDRAYQLLASVAGPLIEQKKAGPLLEALRGIWNKAPKHIPTLEMILRVCERTANELALPEVLEALGRAHQEAGDLEKAEEAYLNLTDREPENAHYRGLLSAVQQKLGRELKPEEFFTQKMALVEEEPLAEPVAVDADQEAMVKEGLDNSDLFARYNLPEKAIAELEKVLRVYPDQIEVHRRILEISRKGFPEQGAVAAAHLARIFTQRGDLETARKYDAIASARVALHEIPLPSPPPRKMVEEPVTPPPAPPKKAETERIIECPISVNVPAEPVAAAPAPSAEAVSLDRKPPQAPREPPAPPSPPSAQDEPTVELDFSGDLEVMTALAIEAHAPSVPEPVASPKVETPAPVEIPASPEEPAPPPVMEEALPPVARPTGVPEPGPAPVEKTVPYNLEDSRIEVEFYIENGFLAEAQEALAILEEKHPDSPLGAELRQRLDKRTNEAPLMEPPAQVGTAKEAVVREEPGEEEWELPTSYAVPPLPEPAMQPVVPPPVTGSGTPPPVAGFTTPPTREPVVEEPVSVESHGTDLLGGLAEDLASSLGVLEASTEAPPATPAAPAVDLAQGAEQLSSLLAEMEEPDDASAKDDPEIHYNLGVAFREMGLLDESIGEFQKVVKGGGKGNYPPHFLQACSLLAICFMEKTMPAIAVKWYVRALETPDLDDEALMALQYDLGVAYEQAGDARNALERFTEVYSQNIDFRDVADKIRRLQQKT